MEPAGVIHKGGGVLKEVKDWANVFPVRTMTGDMSEIYLLTDETTDRTWLCYGDEGAAAFVIEEILRREHFKENNEND